MIEPDALTAAVDWVRLLLTGTTATIVAVLAVATVGLLMLGGRIDFRQGARVILGCFVLFGSSAIASGLLGLSREVVEAPPPVPLPEVAAPVIAPPPKPAVPYDPYAGASVPQPGYDPRGETVPR